VAQLRALAHPLRLRVLELFAERPRTTMQVAEQLGQPPTRLYHHVNALQRAGLIRVRERRPNRGTVEKWFEVVRSLVPVADLRPRDLAAVHRPLQALAMAALEQARRELSSALARPGGRRPLAVRVVAIGSPARVAAIRRRLVALIRDLSRLGARGAAGRARATPAGGVSPRPSGSAARKEEESRERWALTMTFAPVWPQTAGARPRRSSGSARPGR